MYIIGPFITKAHLCNNVTQRFLKFVKIENFHLKTFDIFLIFAQNIEFGCMLEESRTTYVLEQK